MKGKLNKNSRGMYLSVDLSIHKEEQNKKENNDLWEIKDKSRQAVSSLIVTIMFK